jgi:hypothetical protein
MNDEVRARSTTVALVVVTVRGRVHFHAVDGTQSWSGRVETSNEDAVVFDAVLDIVADRQGCEHTRIVVRLRPTSRLRAHVPELEAFLPGVSIETPTDADESLTGAARIGVATTFLSGPPADLPPLVVATDGSVRGDVTGYGWLAGSGDFGLRGFRHSTVQAGAAWC